MKFANILKKLALKFLFDALDKNKDKVIKSINKKLNLPFMGEAEEAELYEAIYELLESVLVDAIVDNDNVTAQTVFKDAMVQKVGDALEIKRKDVAANFKTRYWISDLLFMKYKL